MSAGIASFAQWRDHARLLLAAGVAPHEAQWPESAQADGLFQDAPPADTAAAAARPALRIPSKLLELLQQAACYRCADRWPFLYRVLWRWQAGQHEVMSAADEDGMRLHAMAKTVYREAHRMHAFLRFRERPADAGEPRFIAWFEPEHDVLADGAEHFARRMGNASWLIATPQGCALWNGETLEYGPPIPAADVAADDDGEAMWLAYYRSTFNPARLNPGAMTMHMPVRYWKNLPEGRLIPGLVSMAASGARQVAQAREVGRRCGSVIALAPERAQPPRPAPTSLQQCRRCPLWSNATQAVPGCGPRDAGLMLVGEQPGDQEDLAGQPFVGPAGQLLDDAMAAAGIARDAVYLTNAVKHFKWEARGKRRLHKTPDQREVAACIDWLEAELAEVAPQVVLALGATALRALLGPGARLNDLLGKPVQFRGRWLIATWHPAYVLRVPDPALKAAARADMVRALQLAQGLTQQPGRTEDMQTGTA